MSELTPPVSERDHHLGPADASMLLVEYGDYECPHCGRAHRAVKAIRERLGEKLEYVYRHFPLQRLHPSAELAAEAAEAAAAQGKFWEMHEALFENQEELDVEVIVELAQDLDLDMERFTRDLKERSYRQRVETDRKSGLQSGVSGTPSFFVNGERFEEPWDDGVLMSALLEKAGSR